MLPIPDNGVLQNNPKFVALHKTLTANILNPDASTKHHPTQEQRDARAEVSLTSFRGPVSLLSAHTIAIGDSKYTDADMLFVPCLQELYEMRVAAAKKTVLCNALKTLPLSREPTPKPRSRTSQHDIDRDPAPLPTELIDLTILLSLHLSALHSSHTSLEPSAATMHTLLSTRSHSQQLSTHLSAHLKSHALALSRILNPQTNSSFLHRQIPHLQKAITALQARLESQRRAQQVQRMALVPLATSLLARYDAGMTTCIRVLETRHGQVAREQTVRAELWGTEAKIMAVQAEVVRGKVREGLYTPEVCSALRAYADHLRDGRERLAQREREARRELARYGVGQDGKDSGMSREKIMREVARVYGEMVKEVEEVRRDIERLVTQ